jgi:hypothetical protein
MTHGKILEKDSPRFATPSPARKREVIMLEEYCIDQLISEDDDGSVWRGGQDVLYAPALYPRPRDVPHQSDEVIAMEQESFERSHEGLGQDRGAAVAVLDDGDAVVYVSGIEGR